MSQCPVTGWNNRLGLKHQAFVCLFGCCCCLVCFVVIGFLLFFVCFFGLVLSCLVLSCLVLFCFVLFSFLLVCFVLFNSVLFWFSIFSRVVALKAVRADSSLRHIFQVAGTNHFVFFRRGDQYCDAPLCPCLEHSRVLRVRLACLHFVEAAYMSFLLQFVVII